MKAVRSSRQMSWYSLPCVSPSVMLVTVSSFVVPWIARVAEQVHRDRSTERAADYSPRQSGTNVAMKLRHLVSCVCFVLVCISLGTPQLAAAPQTPTRPNVLLIMPDQMRGDCLSILGHPGVRTPHLDELARQGVLFRRAYSTVPSCIPARYALLTGLFPQTSGVVGFAGKPITAPTLPGCWPRPATRRSWWAGTCTRSPPRKPAATSVRSSGPPTSTTTTTIAILKNAVPASGGIRKLVQTAGLTYNGWQATPGRWRTNCIPLRGSCASPAR